MFYKSKSGADHQKDQTIFPERHLNMRNASFIVMFRITENIENLRFMSISFELNGGGGATDGGRDGHKMSDAYFGRSHIILP